MKRRIPPSPPGINGHVDAEALSTALSHAEAGGATTPIGDYLRGAIPPLEVDDWGQPLPLSSDEQDFVDRIFAILAAPADRGRALLTSGALAPDEVDAIQAVYPRVWMDLAQQAWREMIETPLPYPGWVEDVLGVLFGVEATTIYTSGPPAAPPKQQAGEQSLTGGPDGAGTSADRRDTAVREAKRS